MTVFGAISEALEGKFVYMFGSGTTAKEYQRFLKLCKGKVRPNVISKPVFVFDGAPAHTGEASMKLCAQLFSPLRNVAYSSDLNSIVSAASSDDLTLQM